VTPPALRAEGVRKSFGGDLIVDGADLTVAEGECLLLMGPNGVGKTVLLSCLSGGEPPTEGRVELFGDDVGADGGERLAAMVQDSMAVDALSGRENVDFYAGLHHRFTDRWREYVETLGLADDLDKPVGQYSEGMKRKLELALTLAVDVPLYLLDEPTAGVDLSMVQRFHDAIRERHEGGRTVVMTSHRPMDLELADRVAFVPDGTVGATGPPAELLDALPPVLRVAGADAMDAVEQFLADGRLFPLGGEARGFLADGHEVEDVAAAVPAGREVTIESIEPTYTDLFNYYVHVEGDG
jgi:ABC-2 type transport system ATP-binding protein